MRCNLMEQFTKQFALEIVVYMYIYEKRHLNLDQNTGYHDWSFCGFPQSLHKNLIY
jgi:hypothetical protein